MIGGATVYGTVRPYRVAEPYVQPTGCRVRCTVLYGWRTVEQNRTPHHGVPFSKAAGPPTAGELAQRPPNVDRR